MKFTKEWFFGKDKRDDTMDDYIVAYVSENGRRVEVNHSFTNWSKTWYTVDGLDFETFKEAKEFIK